MVCWVVAGMYPHLVERLVCMAGPHMGLADINMTPEQERTYARGHTHTHIHTCTTNTQLFLASPNPVLLFCRQELVHDSFPGEALRTGNYRYPLS